MSEKQTGFLNRFLEETDADIFRRVLVKLECPTRWEYRIILKTAHKKLKSLLFDDYPIRPETSLREYKDVCTFAEKTLRNVDSKRPVRFPLLVSPKPKYACGEALVLEYKLQPNSAYGHIFTKIMKSLTQTGIFYERIIHTNRGSLYVYEIHNNFADFSINHSINGFKAVFFPIKYREYPKDYITIEKLGYTSKSDSFENIAYNFSRHTKTLIKPPKSYNTLKKHGLIVKRKKTEDAS